MCKQYRKNKDNIYHKSSENASPLLLSYIPLPLRRIPKEIGVRQNKKERKWKYRKERGNKSINLRWLAWMCIMAIDHDRLAYLCARHIEKNSENWLLYGRKVNLLMISGQPFKVKQMSWSHVYVLRVSFIVNIYYWYIYMTFPEQLAFTCS